MRERKKQISIELAYSQCSVKPDVRIVPTRQVRQSRKSKRHRPKVRDRVDEERWWDPRNWGGTIPNKSGEIPIERGISKPLKLSEERFVVPKRTEHLSSQFEEDLFFARSAFQLEPEVFGTLRRFYLKCLVTERFTLAGACEEISESAERMNFEEYLSFARREPPFLYWLGSDLVYVVPDEYEMAMLKAARSQEVIARSGSASTVLGGSGACAVSIPQETR
jgi:hypothetical protein